MIKIKNKDLVKLIEMAMNKSGLENFRLEKDFLLTQVLRELAKQEPTMVFKGGTSLSKGYKDIERFSEDVDVTLLEQYSKEIKRNTVSGGRRLKFNMLIKNTIKNYDFVLNNEVLDKNKEEKEFKSKRYDFEAQYESIYLNRVQSINIDNSSITTISDYEEKEVKPLICEILGINTDEKELSSFKIKVQKREKTITDKFFALCKHYLMGEVQRYARHFYDIYKVFNKLSDEEKQSLKENIKLVAESEYQNCLLEQKKGDKIQEYDMKDLLVKVCDSKKYEEDYNTDVQDLLFKAERGKISYKQCTDIIRLMIKEGFFDAIKYHFVQFKRMAVYKWDKVEKTADRYTLQEFIKNELEENVSQGKRIWDEWKKELEDNGKESENGKYIFVKFKDNKYVCGTGINESFATEVLSKKSKRED